MSSGLALMLVLCATVAPSIKDADVVGLPVASVDVVSTEAHQHEALLSLIDIRPGFLLSQTQVQAAIERLYALEKFAQVEAYTRAFHGAVALTFVMTPKVRLGELRIVARRLINKSALQRALQLAPQDEIDDGTQKDLLSRAKNHLLRQGYPLAQVQVATHPHDTEAQVDLTVTVLEGPAHRVAHVGLRTDHKVPLSVLRNVLKVRVGAVLNQDLLQEDCQRLTELLQAHGFLSAQVTTPLIHQRADGAVVIFNVKAAVRAPLHIVGAHVFSPRDLWALWPTAAGAGPEQLLGVYRQRIEEAYNKAGYYKPRVRVRMRGQPHQAVRQVDVNIVEGPVVWVDRLKFQGAHALPREVLHEQVQAILLQDLDEPSFFSPLGRGDASYSGAPQMPLPRLAHQIPTQHRWNAALYEQAANDIAAAYHDLGFLDATVTPPPVPLVRADDLVFEAPADDETFMTLAPDQVPLQQPPTGRLAWASRPKLMGHEATFVIEEGQQRFIDKVAFEGSQAIDGKTLLDTIAMARPGHSLTAPTAPGAPLSQSGIEDGRIAIVRKLRDAGFLYAKVFAQIGPPDAHGFADVLYTIEEGPAVHVERVLVRGNTHTRQGVIRSRLSLAPGGLYQLSQALVDQREMMALGVFSTVRVRLIDEERQAELKDVVAEVEESPRQLMEVTPGVSTTQGLRLRASYSHLNVLGTAGMFIASAKVNRQLFFDLYGPYADKLKARFGAYRGLQQLTRALEREVRLGLRSPPIKFLRGDPLLRLDVVDQRVNAVRYGLNSTSAILGADLTPFARVKLSADLQGSITELECPLGNDCDLDADVRRIRGGHPIQQGKLHTIKFGPTLHVDGRDDPISPSRGFHAFGRVYQAFGSAQSNAPQAPSVPFAFLKWEGNVAAYLPIFGQVLALSGRLGSIVLERSRVPVDERFFLGGRDSLRGFVETTLIPEDTCVVADTQALVPKRCSETIAQSLSPPLSLGGNTYVLFKGELRMPLRDRFWLDVFCDVGNLWVHFRRDEPFALRIGTGAGLRYATPVGAVTVDFGINPAPRARNREPGYQVHFSIGSF